MKIFLSWSGSKSKKLAETLRDWLPNVIQALEPWMSAEDIDKGSRWYIDVVSELEKTQFGIICLTPENLESPWVHFEAGALSKSIGKSKVCPFLVNLNPTSVKGPLALFQACKTSKEDTKKLIESVNKGLNDQALQSNKLDIAFERWWPDLDSKLHEISNIADESIPIRSDRDIIEEILQIVRSLSGNQVNEEMGFLEMLKSEKLAIFFETARGYEKMPEELKRQIGRRGAID